MMLRKFLMASMIVCFSSALAGCATTTKLPIKLNPEFDKKGVDTITMMPVVDRRVDKKAAIDYDKDLRLPAKTILEKKGYSVVLADSFGLNQELSIEEIGEMGADELALLGPADSKNLLYLYLEDIMESYVVLAYNFKIETTGSLVSKSESIELWRDKGLGTQGQAGLMSGAFSAWDKKIAMDACLYSLFAGLPDKGAPVPSAVKQTIKNSELKPEQKAYALEQLLKSNRISQAEYDQRKAAMVGV